jgi:hypothetical protein
VHNLLAKTAVLLAVIGLIVLFKVVFDKAEEARGKKK